MHDLKEDGIEHSTPFRPIENQGSTSDQPTTETQKIRNLSAQENKENVKTIGLGSNNFSV